MILLWKKGTRVLTAGEMMIRRADRIFLRGTDLQVQNVTPEDGGSYSCEIEADSEYPITVTHTLEVLGEFHLIVVKFFNFYSQLLLSALPSS